MKDRCSLKLMGMITSRGAIRDSATTPAKPNSNQRPSESGRCDHALKKNFISTCPLTGGTDAATQSARQPGAKHQHKKRCDQQDSGNGTATPPREQPLNLVNDDLGQHRVA